MNALALAASLVVAADWASAARELPELKNLGQVPTDDALKKLTALYLRVGGQCRKLDFTDRKARLVLDSGLKDGHSWTWAISVTLGEQTVIEGPTATHGFDRVDDTRTFTDAPKPITGAPGPITAGELAIHPMAKKPELKCWGTGGWTAHCADGGTEPCERCNMLRLVGGFRIGSRMYGDGVVRVVLGQECGTPCKEPGIPPKDFEALAAVVAERPVVDLTAEKVARFFKTKAACDETKGPGLAPDFRGGEPRVP